jgi:cytochrome c
VVRRGVWNQSPGKNQGIHTVRCILLPIDMSAAALGAAVVMAALSTLPARSDEPLSPAARRGFVIMRTNCARCHSIDKVSESPLKIAPPFRTLHERYPVESLEESLGEGIITGHPTMPEFRFDPVKSPTSSPI